MTEIDRHCETCTCESKARRERRLELERIERERTERERDFALRHSVLTDDHLSWARARLSRQ